MKVIYKEIPEFFRVTNNFSSAGSTSLRIIPAVIITLFVLLFRTSFEPSDLTLSSSLTPGFMKNVPDTNIVVITITGTDIDGLGGFPLKRSYYALLTRTLKKYEVKTIGFELLFARSATETDYYDQLFQQEITAAGNVVLSAFAPDSRISGGKVTADSLILPAFKAAASGHLNYQQEPTASIPVNLISGNTLIPSFSSAVTGAAENDDMLQVNFFNTFSSFRRLSLLEFFRLDTSNPDSLSFLKDKIILTGVTDEKFTAKIHSWQEGDVPGLALHAFAADNLLNSRALNGSIYIPLLILAGILFPGIWFLSMNRSLRVRLAVLFGSAAILAVLFVILASSVYIVPLTALVIYTVTAAGGELIISLFREKESARASLGELESLRLLLDRKTRQLEQLEAGSSEKQDTGSNELIASLKSEIEKLRSSVRDEEIAEPGSADQQYISFEGMVFRSQAMKQTVNLIKKFAPSDETVLIIGESGTGKELTAKALHTLSARSSKPFVAVNCGALSESLLESELFGHVKGAFTGAAADKPGRFETADKGTIFLDEIGEISENFQVKLLRVLQEGTLERVGSSKTIKVDVRVIAATNKNLERAVKEGKFRQDLYYRLNILRINLPPLRERKEDIYPLVQNFIAQSGQELKISVAAAEALQAGEWHGNVRELESVIKRALVFARGEKKSVITLSDLPPELTKNFSLSYEEIVLQSLREKGFGHSSFTETAKELGTGRTLINEHFRGVVLRTLSEQQYDIGKTASLVADTPDQAVVEKVRDKIDTILENIRQDAAPLKGIPLTEVKSKLSAKYRNLPKKFHEYLDEAVQRYI
ncbi:MAG: Anaerobic nitric oxide reductase transcription regulator NorR [Ignavibacteriaceae bacterium]|nr:Anaerobic nitric oxide reductase transcription regulator NorR [Ignavibacteriaceae bacterium]